MTVQPGHSRQRGEVASLLTIISMVVITAGLIFGARLNQQAGPINSDPFAAGATPTPVDLGYTGGRWFDGSQGMICAAEFSCNADPIIRKLELRSIDGTQSMNLDADLSGRAGLEGTPLGRAITGSCSSRAYGILIDWDLRKEWTDAQKRNIREDTGYDIKKGQILLSVRQGATKHTYFVYDRPAWLTGSEEAIFYFEFDAQTGGVVKRYSQTAKGKKGCGPDVTSTPGISTTPTLTPIPTSPFRLVTFAVTPSVTPSVTPTPTDGFGRVVTLPVTSVTPTPRFRVVTGSAQPSPTPPDTVISLVLPSGSPTPTTPTALSCNFSALNYVQECVKTNSNGLCIETKAMEPADLVGWSALNNKQIASGRLAGKPLPEFKFLNNNPTEKNDIIAKFPYYNSGNLGDKFNYTTTFIDQPLAAGVNPLKRGSDADLTPTGRATNPILLPQTSVYPNEQYFNREIAKVQLFLKRPDWRVVPEGNEIKRCRNTVLGLTYGACDTISYDENRVLDPKKIDTKVRDVRDTIGGLVVGCGQNIVYGWTVQRCLPNFDYIFVMDTSTSMERTKDVSTGQLKKDAATAELQQFLDTIKASGHNNRVALIQFNAKPNGTRPSSTGLVSPFTTNIDDVKKAVTTGLSYHEGTCIECGLQKTIQLLETSRGDASRKVIVVFLTDGLPNSDPGAPQAGGYEADIIAEANKLKAMAPITVIGIGYGDPSFSQNPAPSELINAELTRVIKTLTTDDTWAFSTTANVSIADIFDRIETNLNSCAETEESYATFMRSKDQNDDGIINTIDLFAIYDNYFAKGDDLKEDLNDDGVVNSLDVSIIINDMGTVLTPEAEQ